MGFECLNEVDRMYFKELQRSNLKKNIIGIEKFSTFSPGNPLLLFRPLLRGLIRSSSIETIRLRKIAEIS